MSERGKRPIVIAHRGASGVRPEHTMAAYQLAIEEGADSIEPDLVMSKDGALICRHENEISGTTDVAVRAEFAARRTVKVVDGRRLDGWFAEDFTLAELKTLGARERLPDLRPENDRYGGEIVTFTELLALTRVHRLMIHPELKHVAFLRERGFDPVASLVAAAREAGGQPVADAMFIESFEIAPLRQAAAEASLKLNCVQLIFPGGAPPDRPDLPYTQMLEDDGLREIARYAGAISVEKSLLLPRDGSGRSLPPTDLCARAKHAGLGVLAWTFRAENRFLPEELRHGDPAAPDFARRHGDMSTELRAAFAAGVDGVFCDFPAFAVAARG